MYSKILQFKDEIPTQTCYSWKAIGGGPRCNLETVNMVECSLTRPEIGCWKGTMSLCVQAIPTALIKHSNVGPHVWDVGNLSLFRHVIFRGHFRSRFLSILLLSIVSYCSHVTGSRVWFDGSRFAVYPAPWYMHTYSARICLMNGIDQMDKRIIWMCICLTTFTPASIHINIYKCVTNS